MYSKVENTEEKGIDDRVIKVVKDGGRKDMFFEDMFQL